MVTAGRLAGDMAAAAIRAAIFGVASAASLDQPAVSRILT